MTKLIFDKKHLDELSLTAGLQAQAQHYDFCPVYEGTDGITVELKNFVGKTMSIDFKDGKAVLSFDFTRRALFFRLLSVLLQNVTAGKTELLLTESTHFTTNGIMLDLSQGSQVLTVKYLKEFFRQISFMGLNMCMLYMEDNYDVPEEPYFGYMRGRYSYEELKELDDYADLFGIELIPAIQTLAHQITVLQWEVYKPIRENHTCMLPRDQRTYEFIRHILTAVTKPFRSKRVHIGMDEAAFLGHGALYKRYGMIPSNEILMDHLARVCKITEEMGLIPMVWNDHFRLTRPLSDTEMGKSSRFMEDAHPDLQNVFWRYKPDTVEWFAERIKANRRKDYGGMYCNCSWTWLGFAPSWHRTIGNMNSMIACRETNVYEAMVSVWMVGFDCDFRVNMLGAQIFAEYCFYEKPSMEQVKERFEFCTDGSFDAFWMLQLLNEVPGCPENNMDTYMSTAPEFLLWQDPMCGLCDYDIDGLEIGAFFVEKAKELAVHAEKAKGTSYETVIEFYRLLADALALKSDLGLDITKAYRDGNKQELARIAADVIPETIRRINALRNMARHNWHQIGKPLGWEAYDLHYGGVLIRLQAAIEEITDYLEGRRERLEELEETRRSFSRRFGHTGRIPAYTDRWQQIVSASQVAHQGWCALPGADVGGYD